MKAFFRALILAALIGVALYTALLLNDHLTLSKLVKLPMLTERSPLEANEDDKLPVLHLLSSNETEDFNGTLQLIPELTNSTLYVITATYSRPQQIAELTRLGQTLMSVRDLFWIVADDSTVVNLELVDLLNRLKIPFKYILTPMPQKYLNKTGPKPKGVANRNGGVQWVLSHVKEGVVYFADDDNTYDVRIFEEMRQTKKVSMWPVGLVTKFSLSTPVLKNGKFAGWYDGWIGGRKFPVDMAGFAVSVRHLRSVEDTLMPYTPGYEETGFIQKLGVMPEDIEFLADNCTKVYVWHTKTLNPGKASTELLNSKYDGTNLRVLQKTLHLKSI